MTIGERITAGGVIWECEGIRPALVGEVYWECGVAIAHAERLRNVPILRPVAIEGTQPPRFGLADRLNSVIAGMEAALRCIRTEIER